MNLPSTTLSPTANATLHFLKPLVGITCASFLACLGMYYGLLIPTEDRHAQVLATLTQLQQQQVHRQTAKITQTQLAIIWNKLPVPEEFSDLGVTITTLAKSNNVQIPGMQYHQDKQKNKPAAKGDISFDAFGPYEAIRKFIFELETSGTYLIIEKLTAERSKKGKDVAFKMRIGTYFKPEGALTVKEFSSP
jgi:Tfp pilus assembly protein PilO